MAWQLQEAKQRFSELVRRTLEEGPQTITRNGEEVVVVIPAADYQPKADGSFAEFLINGPGFDDLELDGDRRLPRDVDLSA
jgi:prevent-host-death family protein